MKSYESYKDSGVEWIREIPSHWSVSKLKFLSNISFSSVDRHEYIEELNVSICHYPDAYKNDKVNSETILSSGTCTETEYEKYQLKKGQVIITKDSESANDIGVPTYVQETIENAVCGYHLAILEPIEGKISGEFLFRYIQSNDVAIYFENNSNGVTRFGLGKPKIENLFVIHPSVTEQTKIAEFLDYKTNLIDGIIEKKKQLIALLKEKRQAVINEAVTKGLNPNTKMKNSGVEWLGEIPEHWEVVRLKQITDAFGRIGYRGYTTSDIVGEDEGAITISPSNMKGQYMTFEKSTYLSWDKYEESPEIQIFNNDILMVKTGSTYGKVGIVKDLEKSATINPQLLVLKNVKINPDYLFNLLRTDIVQNQVETNVIGSTIPTISQTKILNISIPLPPKEEIELILKSIQYQMKLIDKTINSVIIAIEKLQTYRQSLISEAVTGKIDVREWKNNKEL